MFEDLLTDAKKSDINKKDDVTWTQSCHNCNHSSFILSNFPGKILCQKKQRHFDKHWFCTMWIKRKTP
jgi:hypothetical protein